METIKDIVKDMRDWDCYSHLDLHSHIEICRFADRIEAAANATVRTDNAETLHNLLDENARLRAALKPVLECDGTVGESMTAISECQRIFNESEAK